MTGFGRELKSIAGLRQAPAVGCNTGTSCRMDKQDIDSVLRSLERLMRGYNFETTFGLEVFPNCTDYDTFARHLRTSFPDSLPYKMSPISVTKEEFQEDVASCLAYRGSPSSGMILTAEEESILLALQTQYWHILTSNTTGDAKIYFYRGTEGIPGYPVFWDYRYIIFSTSRDTIFLYASSSD